MLLELTKARHGDFALVKERSADHCLLHGDACPAPFPASLYSSAQARQ